MTFTLGVVLFAVGIGLSIALHELGHLLTAKAFGMKATRYFIGFGPTLFSFRRGETEYGLKAVPAGGFVKIVGMTPQEEQSEAARSATATSLAQRGEPGYAGGPPSTPAEAADPRAFWRYPAWQRTIVLAAGSIMHFLIAIVAIYGAALTVGLPAERAVVGEVQPCVVPTANSDGSVRDCRPGDPRSPAAVAGLQQGDQVTRVDGTAVHNYEDLIAALRAHPGEQVSISYLRDGQRRTTTLTVATVQRRPTGSERPGTNGLASVGAIGVAVAPTTVERYGPARAVGESIRFTGSAVTATFGALKTFPEKVPQLFRAVGGEQRDPNGPISVVGATRVGGQALQAGSALVFVLLFAGFNVFVGVFNLFPLLPLDGGHIAILLYEKARSRINRALGRPDPGHVDYAKLMPLTMLVIVVFGGVSLLAILADIVNPIANPFR